MPLRQLIDVSPSDKEQTLDYAINSQKDGVTEHTGYGPASDFRRPVGIKAVG